MSNEYLDIAMDKVIRQEVNKVLAYIRAEIKDLDIYFDNDYFSKNRDAMLKRNEVLAIIDKHR